MNRDEAQRVLAAAEADRDGSDQTAAAVRALDSSIVPALEWLMANDAAASLRLIAALPAYWQQSGRVDEGRVLTEEAVSRFIIAGSSDASIAQTIPGALLAAAELAFRQGDQAQAEKRAHDCIRAAILVDDKATAAVAHTYLARVAYRNGEADAIENESREALALAPDDTFVKRNALHMLAWAAHTAGNLDEAERRFHQSLDYRRKHGSRLSVAVEIGNLGDLAQERGDLAKAARLMAESLEESRAIGSQYMFVNAMPSFAVLAQRAGLAQDVPRLMGAGAALNRSTGLVPDPNASIDDSIAGARASLGDARYDELFNEGERLSSDEAVDLALSVAAQIAR